MMMNRNSVVLFLLGLLSAIGSGQTGYIRQFAKDKPKVVFIAAGTESRILGQRLREAVLDHPENVHKRNEVAVVMTGELKDWVARLDPKEHASFILLTTGQELKAPLPADVAAMLPSGAKPLEGQVSFVQTQMLKPAQKGLAFSVVLYAPDRRRLEWLGREFMSRSFGNWREMPFATEFVSERVALFCSEHLRTVADWWGKSDKPNTWLDLSWYPMDRRDMVKSEDLEYAAEVYLIDRSKPGAVAPEAKSGLTNLQETTLSVRHGLMRDGRKRIVFTAPNQVLLEHLAKRFSNLAKLPEADYRTEAVDLRSLDKALLIVPSENVDSFVAEKMHAQLLRHIERGTGQPLHPALPQGPPNEAPISLLLGKSEESVALRKSLNLRYVWVFVPTAPKTSMSYSNSASRQTSDPGPFTESEPSQPSGKGEEEYRRYKEEYAAWQERKFKWEDARDNMAVYWYRSVRRDTTVTIGGHLRLIDVVENGQVVWEAKVEGSASDYGTIIEQDQVLVKGFEHTPSRLAEPEKDDAPSVSLIIDAGINAAVHGLRRLQGEAWLPEPKIKPSDTDKR